MEPVIYREYVKVLLDGEKKTLLKKLQYTLVYRKELETLEIDINAERCIYTIF